MKQHVTSHKYILFSDLLDKGAEIFTKKKLEHSRSKVDTPDNMGKNSPVSKPASRLKSFRKGKEKV
ncbi:MAG: hypothetical protein ABS69_21445 [Nitrosomonadales bacterium SCN 54-20]|nr:MAG: hypothetical protein ABS69_21445 [Nitrosomonadales bacterium SCN 54-20]